MSKPLKNQQACLARTMAEVSDGLAYSFFPIFIYIFSFFKANTAEVRNKASAQFPATSMHQRYSCTQFPASILYIDYLRKILYIYRVILIQILNTAEYFFRKPKSALLYPFDLFDVDAQLKHAVKSLRGRKSKKQG